MVGHKRLRKGKEMATSSWGTISRAPSYPAIIALGMVVIGFIPGLNLLNFLLVPAMWVISIFALAKSSGGYGRIYLSWLLTVVAVIVSLVTTFNSFAS